MGCNEDGDDDDDKEDHHHDSTPNRCHEQLLVGWKRGAMRMGMMTTTTTTRDDKEDHHHDSTPNHRHKQLLVGWKRGAMRMGMTTTMTTMAMMTMTRDNKEDLRTTTTTALPTAATSNCPWGGNRVQ